MTEKKTQAKKTAAPKPAAAATEYAPPADVDPLPRSAYHPEDAEAQDVTDDAEPAAPAPPPPPGSTKLVRIKPTNKRELHSACGVTILKEDGWVTLPTAVANRLRKEKMNEMQPESSADVFDIMDPADAKAVYEAEHRRVAPSGTPFAPREALHDERPVGDPNVRRSR
jgi:hypothetical protein